MCGIIGYTGKKKALPIIIDGLKSLEYRGYDSAGVAFVIDKKVKTIKSLGKIDNLIEKIDIDIDSYTGIGHTRWATHGGVVLKNAHPHTVNDVTLVHNGIIENYLELKDILIKNGYTLVGDTDTEVLAGYIDYCYKLNNDKIKTLESICKEIIGSYALGIIFHDEVDKIYAMRKDSPLIVGIADDGNYIASDVPSIKKYTNKYFLLDFQDIVVLDKDKYTVYNNNKIIDKEILTYDYDSFDEDISQYGYYMLKEIFEEPNLIRNNIPTSFDNICDISKYKSIYIVGCGSAYHAGMVSKYLMEKYLDKPVYVEIASEFRYKKLFLTEDDLVIFISQSGETADTLASLRIAKSYKSKTLAIVNVFGSSIAREADMVIYTNALVEKAVATTKAYVMQIFFMGLITLKSSKLNDKYLDDYKKLANQIETILDNSNNFLRIAKKIYNEDDVYFLGRGIDYALAMEGSLKLKEISYIHSEAYPAGELKHGTISLIEDGTIVISIITNNIIKDKTLSNIKEVISRGAKSIIIASDNIEIDKSYYDEIIKVPSNNDLLDPILAIIPLQLISFYVAKLKGLDIDKPRNLAKSVTVE